MFKEHIIEHVDSAFDNEVQYSVKCKPDTSSNTIVGDEKNEVEEFFKQKKVESELSIIIKQMRLLGTSQKEEEKEEKGMLTTGK